MTVKEFEKIQEQLQLSDAKLADALDVNRKTVWRWKADKKKIDRITELALLYLLDQSHT